MEGTKILIPTVQGYIGILKSPSSSSASSSYSSSSTTTTTISSTTSSNSLWFIVVRGCIDKILRKN
jgi:hypothetical protein